MIRHINLIQNIQITTKMTFILENFVAYSRTFAINLIILKKYFKEIEKKMKDTLCNEVKYKKKQNW